jgi:glucokinase
VPIRSEWLLVGDIGGTNARFALCDGVEGVPHSVGLRAAADYPQLEAAIDDYLDSVGRPQLAAVALAVAAAPSLDDDRFDFTNSPWSFGRQALARHLGVMTLEVLNDFEALALAVPRLAAEQLHPLRPAAGRQGAARAVLGPGTGLGVAALMPIGRGCAGERWIARAGEGGHVGFAPADEFEIELLRALLQHHGRVSAERVLSGPGLAALHAFMAQREREPSSGCTAAADVTAQAIADPHCLAARSVARFCAMLGAFAGDAALTFGAWDGVYLGGGILPRILPLLERSEFVARFHAKGRMSRCLEPVPIFVITDTLAALRGAAARLRQRDRSGRRLRSS